MAGGDGQLLAGFSEKTGLEIAAGAILEDVLSQVENWRLVIAGMRGAETAEGEQRDEAAMLATGGFMQV